MSSRLSQLLDLVEAALTERCARIDLQTPVYVRGERARPASDELPRITWVRQSAEWSAAVRTQEQPSPRLTRDTTVAARIVAGTEEDAETVLDQLVLACLGETRGSCTFERATWSLVSESSSREEVTLPVVFSVPVYDSDATALIETTSKLSGLGTAGDGILEPDEE